MFFISLNPKFIEIKTFYIAFSRRTEDCLWYNYVCIVVYIISYIVKMYIYLSSFPNAKDNKLYRMKSYFI